MMLSLIGLSSSVGGAIGEAVAAAINSNVFPQALERALPEGMKDQAATIYAGGYLTQVTYEVGSATRDAIDYAWGQSQKNSCIAACAILALGIPAIAIWKDYRVDKRQNKGTVL